MSHDRRQCVYTYRTKTCSAEPLLLIGSGCAYYAENTETPERGQMYISLLCVLSQVLNCVIKYTNDQIRKKLSR